MTLAQDAFVNKVRRLPFLPPSPPSLPSFFSMHLHISFPPSHLINIPPSLPPSLLPSPGERPRQGLGDGREDGLLLRPYDPGKEGGRSGKGQRMERLAYSRV